MRGTRAAHRGPGRTRLRGPRRADAGAEGRPAARFHVPRFVDSATPQMWLCAVCWDEGGGSQWPCATASAKGTEVFTR
ncbi:hypothetical protein [Actinomadura madurae]|uniref:hypothetical protein n=1 Tax=Actinomadura madurae TaxID=1993 RepID=UPI0020D20678|nr:hypothetical protein [Actinomadura madurae]MCQ0012763.1 hypothetical protein [Actinomadura madurae]